MTLSSQLSLQVTTSFSKKFGFSVKFVDSCANFWSEVIDKLPEETQLAVSKMVADEFLASFPDLESTFEGRLHKPSLPITEHFWNLARNVRGLLVALQNDENVYPILRALGHLHTAMGVEAKHYEPMLAAIHKVLEEALGPDVYTARVRFCLNALVTTAAGCMLGSDLENVFSANSGHGLAGDFDYLNSCEATLKHKQGCRHMAEFLKEHFCPEMARFLDLHAEYEQSDTKPGKFALMTKIVEECVEFDSPAEINLSFVHRQTILDFVKKIECEESVDLDTDVFAIAYEEIVDMITYNHFSAFKDRISSLKRELRASRLPRTPLKEESPQPPSPSKNTEPSQIEPSQILEPPSASLLLVPANI